MRSEQQRALAGKPLSTGRELPSMARTPTPFDLLDGHEEDNSSDEEIKVSICYYRPLLAAQYKV